MRFKRITDLHSLCRFLYFNFATGWFPLTGGSDVTAGVDVWRSVVQLMRLLLGSVHRMLQLFVHSHFWEDELTIYSTAFPGCNTHKSITYNKCSESDQCQERACSYFLHPYDRHASVAHFACRIIVKFCHPGWVWRRWLHDAVFWSCSAVRDGEMASVHCIWRPAKQWDLERRRQLAWVFCASKHKVVTYIKFWFEALNNIQWSKTWSCIRHPMQIPDIEHLL